MELTTVEKDNRLILDMQQNHAVANIIRKALWETDAEAGYDKGHPLGDESQLIVDSETPKEDIQEAIDIASGWMEELEGQL
jgi:DNA-directed RNA polymerase subunit L